MKKEFVVKILVLLMLGFNITPVFAMKLDKPPVYGKKIVSVKKNQKYQKPRTYTAPSQVQVQNEQVNPLYPAKYTSEYIKQIKNTYKVVGKDEVFYVALDMLKGTKGGFSQNAVLGSNLTSRPVKIEFKDLSQINKDYANYDALGWKRGRSLYIYINQKHSTSPAIALAALLSHEALHQDEFNSLSEETYAWTMEAAVWCELLRLYPDYKIEPDSLVQRENTLKQMYEKGDYTNKYIKKAVYSNAGYQALPESSPGFEAL